MGLTCWGRSPLLQCVVPRRPDHIVASHRVQPTVRPSSVVTSVSPRERGQPRNRANTASVDRWWGTKEHSSASRAGILSVFLLDLCTLFLSFWKPRHRFSGVLR